MSGAHFFDLSVSASEARAVYLFCLIDIHKRVGVDVADNLFQKGGLSFFDDADKHFSFGIGINAFAPYNRCAAVQNLNDGVAEFLRLDCIPVVITSATSLVINSVINE